MPPLLSVAANVPAPFVNVELAGSTGRASLLVKWTVPVYPTAVVLNGSSAVTVKVNAEPAVAVAGAATVKCEAAAAFTVMLFDVPEIDAVIVSVAVIV